MPRVTHPRKIGFFHFEPPVPRTEEMTEGIQTIMSFAVPLVLYSGAFLSLIGFSEDFDFSEPLEHIASRIHLPIALYISAQVFRGVGNGLLEEMEDPSSNCVFIETRVNQSLIDGTLFSFLVMVAFFIAKNASPHGELVSQELESSIMLLFFGLFASFLSYELRKAFFNPSQAISSATQVQESCNYYSLKEHRIHLLLLQIISQGIFAELILRITDKLPQSLDNTLDVTNPFTRLTLVLSYLTFASLMLHKCLSDGFVAVTLWEINEPNREPINLRHCFFGRSDKELIQLFNSEQPDPEGLML